MSETITLQEIAGYLPYGLQVMHKPTKKIFELGGITPEYGGSFHMCNLIKDGNNDGYANFIAVQPLVIPLDELTKEDFRVMGYSADYWLPHFIKGALNGSISLKDYQYLLSHHYDVHGWIERGLAISKSEYLKTIR